MKKALNISPLSPQNQRTASILLVLLYPQQKNKKDQEKVKDDIKETYQNILL